MPTQTYIPLATITLGSAAATVTFSSIAGSYRDLRLVASNVSVAGSAQMYVDVNNDSGGNYHRVTMRGDGSAAGSVFEASATYIKPTAFLLGSGSNAQFIFDWLDYSATDKHKTMIGRYNHTGTEVVAIVGRWASTAVITSLRVSAFGVNFNAGSTFSLYGIAS